MYKQVHQPTCPCPICRAGRGERTRKVPLAFRVPEALATLLVETARREGTTQNAVLERLLRSLREKKGE